MFEFVRNFEEVGQIIFKFECYLSDTLVLKSPTATEQDKEIAKELARIAEIDIQDYGMEMLKAGSSLKG